MRPTQLTDRSFHLGRDLPRRLTNLMAPIDQTGRALSTIAAQPRMHILPTDAISFRDLGHRNAGHDLENGPVSLLGHAQLPQHERECQASSGADV